MILNDDLLTFGPEARIHEAKARLHQLDVDFVRKLHALEKHTNSRSLEDYRWLDKAIVPKSREYRDFLLDCLAKT